jgi:hypothetical protein
MMFKHGSIACPLLDSLCERYLFPRWEEGNRIHFLNWEVYSFCIFSFWEGLLFVWSFGDFAVQ